MTDLHVTSSSLECYFILAFSNRGYSGASLNLAACFDDLASKRCRNLAVIDNCRVRNMQGAQARCVRLNFAKFFGGEEREARHAVGGSAPVQFFEHRYLGNITGHNDLATLMVAHRVFVAEASEQLTPTRASARLGRAGFVVNAGVNDAAVVTGLVVGKVAFFFEHDDRRARITPRQLMGCRETYYPAADNGDIKSGIS